MGNKITLGKPPQRIISLVPSQTELLYDLGLGERVVGITKFCIHPENWLKEKAIVGGTKNFRFDAIDELQPDLIIGNKEENYQEGIQRLAEKYPVWMSDIFTLEDSLDMIRNIGHLTDTDNQSKTIVERIENGFRILKDFENKSVAYFIWKEPYMIAAKSTFIDDMLTKLGLVNAFPHHSRYVEISIGEIEEVRPDFIFLSSEPFPFKAKNCEYFRNLLPESIVKVVDGEKFSWYGSRLIKAKDYFNRLYEEINCNN